MNLTLRATRQFQLHSLILSLPFSSKIPQLWLEGCLLGYAPMAFTVVFYALFSFSKIAHTTEIHSARTNSPLVFKNAGLLTLRCDRGAPFPS